jgi:hypothetical protein
MRRDNISRKYTKEHVKPDQTGVNGILAEPWGEAW